MDKSRRALPAQTSGTRPPNVVLMFFACHADPRYDVWRGGAAKSTGHFGRILCDTPARVYRFGARAG